MPARRRNRQWRRAWKPIRILIFDSERTDAVFELYEALGGPTDEQAFRSFVSQPEGRRQLRERPDLLATLSDHAFLATLPEGSLGRRYLEFMQEAGLNARDLVDAKLRGGWTASGLDADRLWLVDRGRDAHDLWHVLTGYGRDELGEIAHLAFTYANHPNPGILLLLLASLLLGPKTPTFRFERYLLQAYRRGKAADLEFAPYEAWLHLPLPEVQARAKILAAEIAHPRTGILEGNRAGGTGSGSRMRMRPKAPPRS